ncbi:hypothetical protein ACFXMT_29560 [Streptomyces mirabilis]|uniref:hypothetical protein n=1 Tax=Streptomyces mirabilis TaxID=68239 RepID=UPI00366A42A5
MMPPVARADEGPGRVSGATATEPAIKAATYTDAISAPAETGYPRNVGDGIVADIDPLTRTVEAVLVDGAELDYGLNATVAS